MKMKIRVFIPEQLMGMADNLARAAENALTQSAESVKVDFGTTVRTWNRKPEFMIEADPGRRYIGTDNQVYSWLDKGTKGPYRIPKVGFANLHFFKGGKAKTRPEFIGSNKGKAGKDERFATWVMHPGIKDRKFQITIQTKWDKEAPRQLQRAIDAEVKRMGL